MQQIKKPKKNIFSSILWIYVLIGLFLVGLFYTQDSAVSKEVKWSEFEAAALKGDIESVVVHSDDRKAEGVLTKNGAKNQKIETKGQGKATLNTIIPSTDKVDDSIDGWNAVLTQEGKPAITVEYKQSSGFTKILYYFGPILIFIIFMVLISRRMGGGAGSGGGIFSVGKSKPKVFDKNNNNNVTFKDVAGLAEAKIEIQEIVEFLKNPKRYTELGAKIPKGALLVGPPGTGKTLLAKAVAGEAGVPFLSMSGSDFVEMFVGVGAARVRDLFKQAKEKAPCIVFIDEIDAVGRARGKNPNMGSNDERENTLNQMLTEMDGFGTNNGVIILAATNRADMLDKALLRPGRFDRQIYVDLPELSDRVEIFNVHLRNIKVNATIDIEHLARQTPGFSGADIANVCNEAALIAARNNKQEVEIADFRAAIDRVIGGLEKSSKVFTKDEKFAIATHEAGHATVSWMLEFGEPLVKVTIVPRGRAQGYAMYAPEERQYYPTQAYIDKICSLVAGRAAEDLFTGQISLGAFDDLEKATKAALSLVAYYGYSDKLKNINYYDSNGQTYGFAKPYSEHTAKVIDEEVARIVNEQYERAKEILRQYADQHNKIRDLLVERESVFTEDVKAILGERQWKSRTDEIMAIKDEVNRNSESQTETQPTPAPTPATPSVDENEDDDPGTPPPFVKP
ncbi:MAG: ATP-dependent zinc metalloprotease FtsH [Muribaculaceae bacterium]|nr:ATP-dependent zinc metalloprotease FtsH [Muribaculaceae bacterium]